MRLISVHIRRFKSVDDSGQFDLEPDVTALVGKNESGKTAALQALYRVNPVASGYSRKFDALRDYPRGDYNEDEADGNIGGLSPVTAIFKLNDDDKEAFGEQFGPKTLRSDAITISRRYNDDTMFMEIEIDELAMVKYMVTTAGVDEKKYAAGTSVQAIVDRLQGS